MCHFRSKISYKIQVPIFIHAYTKQFLNWPLKLCGYGPWVESQKQGPRVLQHILLEGKPGGFNYGVSNCALFGPYYPSIRAKAYEHFESPIPYGFRLWSRQSGFSQWNMMTMKNRRLRSSRHEKLSFGHILFESRNGAKRMPLCFHQDTVLDET